MLTTLLIAVSIWGTDPEVVFSEARTPSTRNCVHVAGSPASSTSSNGQSPVSSVFAVQSHFSPDVIRAQTVTNDNTAPSREPAYFQLWDNPEFREFVSAMNPFVNEDVKTIPWYYDPFGNQMGTGTFGRQGYRMGWVTYDDLTILPSVPARGTSGSFKDVEWNSSIKYSEMVAPGVLFNGTGFFNARWWDGPDGVSVPGQVDQVSTDLELGFFNDGPWSGQIAFHPQLVETYDAKLDRNAFNFDGRAIAMYRASPQWSFVGGFAIWDRVNTLIIPHVGAIWTPNNRWEFRVLFPKTRISYFLGRWNNADFWMYGQAEYTAEAFQSVDKETSMSDRIQITDDRLTLGLRWDKGRYSIFTEGGFVFDRHVKFAGSTPAFDLSNSGLFRVGIRY